MDSILLLEALLRQHFLKRFFENPDLYPVKRIIEKNTTPRQNTKCNGEKSR